MDVLVPVHDVRNKFTMFSGFWWQKLIWHIIPPTLVTSPRQMQLLEFYIPILTTNSHATQQIINIFIYISIDPTQAWPRMKDEDMTTPSYGWEDCHSEGGVSARGYLEGSRLNQTMRRGQEMEACTEAKSAHSWNGWVIGKSEKLREGKWVSGAGEV